MKVLMVTNIYPKLDYPGQGSFIKSQVDSIEREGIDVEVISIHAKKSRLAYLHATWEIFKKSFRENYDLIHAHYGFSGIVARLQFRIPVMISFCGGDVLGNPKQTGEKIFISQIYVALNQIIAFFVTACIVKSEEMQKILLRKKRVFVIPNGVDFTQFKPFDKLQARKSLRLDVNKKYVLFPANPAWRRKCYPVAEKAVQILKDQDIPIEMIVLHSKPQHLVPMYMNACDAMVLTSFWEGSPNVIKEAMACNLPIVSVDVGDVKKVLKNCEGCFISERNPRMIADYLKRIFDDVSRTKGRDYIQHLEIQNVAQRIITIYQNILRNRTTHFNSV